MKQSAVIACALAGAGVVAGYVAFAGPIDPPPGPVAPTYKTLGEVEPRVNVNGLAGSTKALHVITQPGSYYLTANIEPPGSKDGILITASPVVLDLNGMGVREGDDGIVVAATYGNVTIRNGSVASCGNNGISASTGTVSVIVEGVHAHANGRAGICVSYGRVSGCSATYNGLYGIEALAGVTVSDCAANLNAAAGILAFESCSVENCTAMFNGADGIVAVYNSSVRGCVSSRNTAHGFLFSGTGGLLENCEGSWNGMSQVSAATGARIVGNRLLADAAATGAALLVWGDNCTVEHNSVVRDGTTGGEGIRIDGEHSFIGSNRVSARFSSAFVLDPKNSWGPVVDVYQDGDISGAPGSTHPSANFVH